MNWKLYKKDDPNTYPEIDCWVLACKTVGDDYYLARCRWNKGNKCFVGDGAGAWDECYYAYIGYIPKEYVAIKVKKCSLCHGSCDFEDDGYCEQDNSCRFAVEMNEYSFDNKRVWKNF